MFYERELGEWRSVQQAAVDVYADEAAQIEARRESWEATIAPENRDGGASALMVRVGEVLALLKTSERALAEPMTAQLAMGRRASTVQASIDAGLKAVRARDCELRSPDLAYRCAAAVDVVARRGYRAERTFGGDRGCRRRPRVSR